MSEPNEFVQGQFYERGAWVPTRLHARNAVREIVKHFGDIQKKHELKFGKLQYEILDGDNERVPKPKKTPFFVTVYATVEKKLTVEHIDVSWVHDLRLADLERLRVATKRAAAANDIPITMKDIDVIIGFLGPIVARKMLEEKLSDQVVDGKVLKAAERRLKWQA